MGTPIRIKRSAVPGKKPQVSDLQVGELALNTHDAELVTLRQRAFTHRFVSSNNNSVNVQSGAENGNQKTPNGATYIASTGVLTLDFGSVHGMSTNDTITLDNDSLKFTCNADNYATEHTYPRLTDPIAGVTTAVTVTSATQFTLNVGKGYSTEVVNTGAGATVTNIIYVTKDGNDNNTGLKLGDAKGSVRAALSEATKGTTVRISAGSYIENNPLNIPEQVSVVGDSLREVSITPQNPDKDLFYVANGDYVSDISFTGTVESGKAIFSFHPTQLGYVDQSPYIRNCTNFVKNSIGLKIDGSQVIGPLKPMVLDSFTQYNENGIGCSITNEGYAQLVSMFTICDDIAVYTKSGGQCDLTNSNSSFGNYGLISDGVGPRKYTGIITTIQSANKDSFEIDVSTVPYTISNATYDGSTGILTATTSTSHNFEAGQSVTLSKVGFTCNYGNFDHTFVTSSDNSIVPNVGSARSAVSGTTYNPLTGELVLNIGSGHGLAAQSSVTPLGAAYTPTTGVLDLTYTNHGFVGSTSHQAVSGTTYDPATGILTVKIAGHGFAVGERIRFDDGALRFTCDKDSHGSNHDYPRSTDPASGKWLVIRSTTTDTFTVDVGASSYAGTHTFVSGTATGVKKANDWIKITDKSLRFTCDKDNRATNHDYPRITDPAHNTWLAIGSTTSNTFGVDVGVSPDTSTHYFDSCLTNCIQKANNTIGIGTTSYLTFTCSFDDNATNHNYPRSTDPAYDKVLGVEAVSTDTITVNVGVSTNDIFPSGKYGTIFDVKERISSTQFSTYVGMNTHPHTYAGGGKVELDVVRPYDGQVVYFDELYDTVGKITVGSGGTGYTSNPTVTVEEPSEPWGIQATAVAQVKNGVVDNIELVSSGRGYTSVPGITISSPNSGINTATATLTTIPTYYSITAATPIVNGISTITVSDNVPYVVGLGSTVPFFRQSKILASSHSFEYVGSGVTMNAALPQRGGLAIQDNEIFDRNGGLTVFTSTDQTGNFRIGDGVIINQQTGTISGVFYSKSLFSTMTPFILALGG